MKPVWLRSAEEYIRLASENPDLLSSIDDNPYVNQMERLIEDLLWLPENRVIAVSSATAGMVAILRALGIGKDDEVIVPAFSWGQTLDPVLEVGAIPVFVDIEPDGVNIDLSRIEEHCGMRTKAIIATELFGIPLDWMRLHEIAEKTGLYTIVDSAQSFGALHWGQMPTAMVFSFGRGKLICGGEGGAIAVNSANLYDAAILTSQHPIRAMQNLQADIPYELMDSISPNARIHPFSAVLIHSQITEYRKNLCKYHYFIIKMRRQLEDVGLKPVPIPSETSQSPKVIPMLTDDPDDLKEFCYEFGWEVNSCCQKPLVFSPTVKNLQFMPALKYIGFRQRHIKVRHTSDEYPNTIRTSRSLYLVDPFTDAPQTYSSQKTDNNLIHSYQNL
jgi:dTDP-4-amino-4,6-dideoxygalactose transaminase